MRLSRDKIQRMINAGGGSSSGGGGGSDIAGGATQAWVNMNYVSIEFFRKVFKVWAAGETSSDPDVEIMPNDITTTVKNIQAQAGLWTEAFLSALGQGSGGGTGGATTLDQLDDVVITSPTNGQALIYNSTTQMWVNGTIQSGTDMATVWSALAAATNEQINASHLSGVLADYVTTTSLQTTLGDYLTQTSADQRYITIAYFDRLFRAYNGNTLVSHNDTTTTIDNIKAMFGFWTDMYLSALGRNSTATGLGIDNLTDVTINTPTDGQVLQYNATSSKWENATIQTVVALSGLTDVLLTSVSSNQILIYDAVTQKWVNSSVKTINGYSIFGTGDIPASGGGTGNYLPIVGGTIQGSEYDMVTFNRTSNNGAGIGFSKQGTKMGDVGFRRAGEFQVRTGVVDSETTRFLIDTTGKVGIGTLTPENMLHVAGAAKIDNYLRINTTHNSSVLNVGGIVYVGGGTIDVNGTTARLIEINRSDGGSAAIAYYSSGTFIGLHGYNSSGDFFIRYGSEDGIYMTSTGRVGVGTDAPANKFHVGGAAKIDNYLRIATDSNSYTLNVGGTIYATGAITALSDARKKDITGEAGVTVEQIAHAPAVQFLWKDKERRKDGQQVGTLAQYWQTVLPEVVMDKGGELSMQYGVAALVSAIVTARKVVDHERRIQALENKERRLG